MPETPASNNPWWRSCHCQETPPNADATSSSIIQHVARSKDSIGGGDLSRCSLIPSSLAETSTTSEICSSSDTSYATCHSLVLEQGSEAHSTPTLLSSSPPLFSYTVEDEWQSKGDQANTIAFPKLLEDDYEDEAKSVEDWGEEPEGLAIDNLDDKVMTFISSDQPGRQARLRQYSSGDFTRAVALQEVPALKIATPTSLSTPSPALKPRLSLSDFLSELRALPTDEEVACGDESFESSVMDDEEADSIQICRAWRQSIAFANLGASHPNQPLLQKTNSKESLNRAATTPSKPTVRHRLSRVSLQTLSLETIEEVAVAPHDLPLPAPFSPPSEADSLENLDVCAHLLKRAKADIVSRKSV